MFCLERDDGRRIGVGDKNLQRTNVSADLLAEAWRRIPADRLPPDGQSLRITLDMGRVVGRAAIVKAPQIKPNEVTWFARRRHTAHHRPSRIIDIPGRLPTTNHFTIVAEPDAEGRLLLRTAYCGHYVYPQPWDFGAMVRNGFALDRVLDFWCRAAFLYRPLEFETAKHDDSLAGLIDAAARRSPNLAKQAGYDTVCRLWMTPTPPVACVTAGPGPEDRDSAAAG